MCHNWVTYNNRNSFSRYWRLEIQKQSVGRVMRPLNVLASSSFWLVILGIPWVVDTFLQSPPPFPKGLIVFLSPLSLCYHKAFSSLCVSMSKCPSSSKDTRHWNRVYPTPEWPHLKQLHLQKPNFQTRSRDTRGYNSTYLLGDKMHAHQNLGSTKTSLFHTDYSLESTEEFSKLRKCWAPTN